MNRRHRKWEDHEIQTLKWLWPSVVGDKEIAYRLGRCRGVVRRKAEVLGLPPRRIARIRMMEEGASKLRVVA